MVFETQILKLKPCLSLALKIKLKQKIVSKKINLIFKEKQEIQNHELQFNFQNSEYKVLINFSKFETRNFKTVKF